MQDRAIPRQHHPVLESATPIGEVTSGTFSPTFGKGLGLAFVPPSYAKVGTDVEIDIRGVGIRPV